MSRIDFRMDKKTKVRLKKSLKDKGYQSISEFFRQKAREVVENG